MTWSPREVYPFSLFQRWFKETMGVDDPILLNFYIMKAENLGHIERVMKDGIVCFRIPLRSVFIEWTKMMAKMR